ncbi:hypothetical protein [Aestuariibaculum sediminum]|uniref:Uncharacterized protein n=1 Tax=Aestuariibaculum sediminum TaxID=2770637 RepID=A0A8J6PZ26_9FLAO|nr:hypothetical protein [Aestuariibaculum sediminum]MBD0831518.1 hypothetical protein [Aestuariibaculum sediminum]
MKQSKVYKDIRKQAMIMGLPLALFALLMTSVLVSLLVIIFSFSVLIIVLIVAFNLGLYITLTHLAKGHLKWQLKTSFPKTISSKKLSPIHYE